ncbi:P1 family peptidase [Pseudochrobactrum sp. MP213Fo]|uniref:DmpA family aminopeptidase n=1 Tax=Pseudochrobactrum sp. MP213Fo TaxID=3022250 RepID=UPI003B9EA757
MSASARDFGIICGTMPAGKNNAITDVPGVKVGHTTIRDGNINTGVTAILPHSGNLFRTKVLAASESINGFGKSAGLVQVNELGTLETPILLTNTLSVGTCVNALVKRAIEANSDIGRTTSTVNAVVGECNDGPLNDIQAMGITEAHAFAALDQAMASADGACVEQGNVGAGTGMTCFGFKGGIGTASRRITLGGKDYHLGTLVLSNFGRKGDLSLPDGRHPTPDFPDQAEKGSIMMIMATDIPLEHRQLQRVIRRCGAGIARLGAFWGHGSGDIVIGFTTGVTVDHDQKSDLVAMQCLNEDRIDQLFRAATESTQEAILNSMCAAEAFTGRDGATRNSLADWLHN